MPRSPRTVEPGDGVDTVSLVTMDLRLMPYTLGDQAEAMAANELMAAEGNTGFLLFWHDAPSWPAWVQSQDDAALGLNLATGWVPAAQLKAVVDGMIIGRVSIRFELSEVLFRRGGHIGYYVLPQYRGNGNGTEMLRQSLVIARSRGVGPVLITCDNDNVALAAVAERCGGVLEAVVTQSEGATIRRYWIM